ncbi:MAG: hypothetical protein QM750_17255 [Rubrivivax sp.]
MFASEAQEAKKRAGRTALIAPVVLACAACTPSLNWREWRSDETGLVQAFPCKPARQQRQVTIAGRAQLLVLEVCDADGVSWALAHTQASEPAAVGPLLDALAAAAHANLGVVRSSLRPHAVPGATPQAAAGRYAFAGRDPRGRALQAQVLVFARGLLVVQLTALGEQVPEAAVETFFGSVRAGA